MELSEAERLLQQAGSKRLTLEQVDALTRVFFGATWTVADGGLVRDALSSIDAALALCERLLPGRPVGFLPHFYKEHAYAGIVGEPGKAIDLLKAEIAGGPTPALAILIATLKALNQGERK